MIQIGPGGTPFFSALPLGVANGGTLSLSGGKGLYGFQTRLFFKENLTLLTFLYALLPAEATPLNIS